MHKECEEGRVIVGLEAVLYGESHQRPELGRMSKKSDAIRDILHLILSPFGSEMSICGARGAPVSSIGEYTGLLRSSIVYMTLSCFMQPLHRYYRAQA